MKEKKEILADKIKSIPFNKLLSISHILKDATRFGKYCCLKEVSTSTDKDIFKYPIRIDAYVFVVCSDGLIELTYNLYNMKLSSNSMFLYTPGTIVRINVLKPSNLSLMIFTREFIDELGIKIDNVPLQYKIVRDLQPFPLSIESCSEIKTSMAATINFIHSDKSNAYYAEMVKSSFKTFIYRALYEIKDKYIRSTHQPIQTQNNIHFENFMRLLDANYTKHHSIKFYSEKMGLSPKYLSLMIKKVSGKLATEWIDDYVILEAKNLIKYSSMNIQEISYALNFPNQSFFGKYFKRHTGLSPKAYRLQP